MAEEAKTRRLFFALWPDDAAREALAQATRKATRASGGRPVPVENLHSTMAFLGAIPEARLAVATAVAAQVRQPAFQLVFDRLEHWPKQALLCATCVHAPPEAGELAAELWKLLAGQGFARESKPYRPHVTLARKVVKPHALGDMHPVAWPIDEFALVESVTASEGARYTVLQRWPLAR
ncbi:MAG TPA: RNA 2',3'-cyclic phosphodiesterase [Steroidobacteraceae bacterium]|nr:RNA 2',3'-cyclic phosphodiesterase [Steroidobacteraceae bacterium]